MQAWRWFYHYFDPLSGECGLAPTGKYCRKPSPVSVGEKIDGIICGLHVAERLSQQSADMKPGPG